MHLIFVTVGKADDKMKLRRIMIAAPKSGSGKTTVICALLQALKNRGEQAAAYKCGPDYIDPMFHEKVIGIPSKNLDTFFTGEKETRELFWRERAEGDFAVLEGVMGLYDGLGGIREEGSSYHLAKVTKTPVVLVVDTKGMGRSVIPVIAGFLAYDREKLIRGVILNRTSKAYYERMKPLVEEELRIRVLGYLPDCRELHMQSRHLGLVMPDELPGITKQLQRVTAALEESVSVEKIVRIAEQAEDMEEDGRKQTYIPKAFDRSTGDKKSPVIAVAKDEAFCFYYKDNLRMLEEYGARIQYFSPIHDTGLPEGCHALLFGGGYPELYGKQLSRNTTMRRAVKRAFDLGMPIVAECGGFMYLHSAMEGREGERYEMAGVIPAVCSDTGKLVRFGYVEIKEKKGFFLPQGERIRGHEFHYFDSTDNGDSCLAVKPVTGREYPCVIGGKTFWLGFPHLYYPSNPAFAERFVKMAWEYMLSG